ncbi:SLAM family member 9-like isoform X2 [Notamacropus eugenii]|uniref:SLAM family member 9-like isoform X2 n=1 Tax=Notamacropus eugenii TaxID=9315 RepID=UPI003B67723E
MSFRRWNLGLLMLIISSQVHSARHLISTIGESVKLKKSESFHGPFSEVSWFYNETQKLLTWYKATNPVTFKTNLQTRISLEDNVTLHIQQLQKEDSSTYKLKVFLENTGKEHSEYIKLEVYERLTEPEITPGPRINDDGTCLVNVTCSVEKAKDNVTYSWMYVRQGVIVSSEGPILSISWKCGDYDQYTCTAKNPVSNNSRTILASEICTDKTSRVSQELKVILPSILSLLFILNWTQ